MILTLILILGAAFRSLGPYLAQANGDSLFYVAMAMKLRNYELKHFNVRGIGIYPESLDGGPTKQIISLKPVADVDPEGDFLRDLKKNNYGYFDVPFPYKPIGLPCSLALIHFALGHAPDQNWTLVKASYEPRDLLLLRPWALARTQWPWLVIPFFSSMALIALVYAIGKRWFGEVVGLWSAFLLAIHPVDILTAQRIWADDVNALFCLLAFALAWRAVSRSSTRHAIYAGACLGVALLMKQFAFFFASAILCVEILRWKFSKNDSDSFAPFAPRKLWVGLALGFVSVIAYWTIFEWQEWGRMLAAPPNVADLNNDPWTRWLVSRPHPLILHTLGLALLCPATALCALGWRDPRVRWILLVTCVYLIQLCVVNGREYRYSSPLLPFAVMAGGFGVANICVGRKWLAGAIVTGHIAWSLYLTNQFAWRDWGDIRFPF